MNSLFLGAITLVFSQTLSSGDRFARPFAFFIFGLLLATFLWSLGRL